MEFPWLPKGFSIVSDPSCPETEARLYSEGEIVGKIENIKIDCPVVRTYKRKKPRTIERTIPDPRIANITYDPGVSLEQVEKQYVLLALRHANGSISEAARLLKIGKNTVYRHLGKRYGKQYQNR